LQREANHSLYVILLSLVIVFFALGSLLVLSSDTAETAFFGFRIQHIGQPFVGGLWFLFTMDVCGYPIKKKPAVAFLMALPVIMVFGVTTGDPLGLFVRELTYGENGFLPFVAGDFTLLYSAGLVHVYGFNLVSGILIGYKLFRPANRTKSRLLIHLFTGLLPAAIGLSALIFNIPYRREAISTSLCVSSVILNLYLLKTGAFRIVAKAKYQLFESVQDGIVIINGHNEYMDSNDKAKQIFPILGETKPGTPVAKINGGLPVFSRAEEKGGKFTVSIDGKPRHYSTTWSELLEDHQYIGSTLMIYDVTDTVSLLNDLQKAIEEASAANQAKSVFLANMSHEIRTPMNSIMGFAELAAEKAVSPHVKEYIGKITDSTKWLLHIINDILDISKIESGKMELESVPFDLYGIFTRCQSVIHPNVAEKGLDLRVYAEAPAGKRLLGDPVRLYQALMNLLSNAVKFTNSGTVKMSSAISNSSDDKVTVYFEIKDSGIGMSAEQIDKIFESFMQADSSTTRNYGGTGLGLTIAKNIVHLMGGKLSVESAPGEGSAFSFEITFETTEETTGAVLEYNEVNTIEKPYFEGRILICEDNSMNQRVICDHLERVGLLSVVAENGKIGVEMVKERAQNGQPPFDMIFMDIFMPVMDGIEASEKITALGTGTPIVAMTANVMSGELENYKKCGIDDCVGKPFTTQELWRCLAKYLNPVRFSAVKDAGQNRENADLQKKLRVKFVKDNQTTYAKIKKAVEAGDTALAHRLAHTLKSNAGQIGKNALQNAAAEAEGLLKDEIIPATGLLDSLEAELDSVLAELRTASCESGAEAEAGDLDAGRVLALFEKLEPMLENINPECVELAGEIRAVPGGERLARQIEDYNFESAARILAELKKSWV